MIHAHKPPTEMMETMLANSEAAARCESRVCMMCKLLTRLLSVAALPAGLEVVQLQLLTFAAIDMRRCAKIAC